MITDINKTDRDGSKFFGYPDQDHRQGTETFFEKRGWRLKIWEVNTFLLRNFENQNEFQFVGLIATFLGSPSIILHR